MREISFEDEDLLLDLDSDPLVMRYLTNGVPSTRAQIKQALERINRLHLTYAGKFGVWAAFESSRNEFMGWFLFRPDKKDPENTSRLELGYRLKQKFWGQGYATEGSRAILQKGFSELALEHAFAQTMKNNLASQNVRKKVGMKFIRQYHDPEYVSIDEWVVEYGLSRSDWFQKSSPDIS